MTNQFENTARSLVKHENTTLMLNVVIRCRHTGVV